MALILRGRTTLAGATTVGWSPAALFAAGEQGAWFDPSDLTTMFTDTAGTTQATVGQGVALILDKSRFGPELVTNGDFSGGTTGWTAQAGTTFTVTSGVASVTGNQGFAGQSFTTVIGRVYRAVATLKASPGIAVFAGVRKADNATNTTNIVNVIISNTPTAADQTASVLFTATATTTWINIQSNSSGTVLVDNISVREATGNHATQATLGSRPTLQVEGGKYYLSFDGSDDSLVTGSVNFSATDKMSVFAGFKTSDESGFDGLVQLGTVASGGFWAYTNGTNLEFKMQGSLNQSTVNVAYGPSAASVMSAKLDLGGATGADCLNVRKNGASIASATVQAGAANFQNGALSIGFAVGVRINGRLHSLIVRGATTSAADIARTERYVANRTGVAL